MLDILCVEFDTVGETGADSVILSSLGGGVLAFDSEGEGVADTPNLANCLNCSDFCFFNNLSASICALLCSRASRFPDLVAAPKGRPDLQDMNVSHAPGTKRDHQIRSFCSSG